MPMSSSLESPLPRVPPARPVARDHPAMEAKGVVAPASLESRSGVAHDDGDPLRLPVSSSSSERITSWSFLLLFAPLPFAKRDMARAAPIAVWQRARGLRFSCRPQRSCSVVPAKLVSHVCDRGGSAVSRRAGLGWRRARRKFFAGLEGAKVR